MPQQGLWEYVLRPEDGGKKYQQILKGKFHFSQKLIQQLKQGEHVWVNDKFTYLTARGQTGDRLAIELALPEANNFPGEALPLDIIYEDEYILAVNKPVGQVVHPTPRYPTGTLGNAVLGYFTKKGESRPFRPVHRIDRNTSGVTLIAKSRFAHQQLAWQLEHGQVVKHYLGFTTGILHHTTRTIDNPIGLAPGSFIQHQVHPEGLPARTNFRLIRNFTKASLVEFTLETGRTHQIRVHCQAIGHPLLGDDLYGGDCSLISRQALHSFTYAFQHPATGLPLTIHAPFPEDLKQLLKILTLSIT